MKNNSINEWRPILILLVIFAAMWFGTLDHRRIINPDEGRYAEIPREMVANGDWITPRLNDLKYFEKPALQYWATATAFTLFGEHNWTARLWAALTGFLGILVTGFATARLFNSRAGLIAGTVIASSLLWNLIGHINTLDMGVSFFLIAAVFSLCLAQQDSSTAVARGRWQDISWAMLGLAILSKGLIGLVLPAGTVVFYILWQRDWDFLRRIRPIRGLVILLIVTAPWFILVSIANPEFANFFFIHEHFQRFLTKVHGRYQPAWYFVPILLVGMIPWLTLIVPAMVTGHRKVPDTRFQPARFLFTWTVFVFIFFSISSSKLTSYILPILPTLACLIGIYLSQKNESPTFFWHAAPALVIGVTVFFLVRYLPELTKSDVALDAYQAYQPWLYSASAALAGCGLTGIILARSRRILAAVITLAFGGFLFGQLILLGHDNFGKDTSARDVAVQIQSQVPRNARFFSVNMYDHSFQYYLKRTTTVVIQRDELSFGIDQEPEKFIATLTEFEQVWRSVESPWAIMPPDTYKELLASALPMIEVTRDARRVIVRKP